MKALESFSNIVLNPKKVFRSKYYTHTNIGYMYPSFSRVPCEKHSIESKGWKFLRTNAKEKISISPNQRHHQNNHFKKGNLMIPLREGNNQKITLMVPSLKNRSL